MAQHKNIKRCYHCKHFCIKPRKLDDDGEDSSLFFKSVTLMLENASKESLGKADIAALRTSMEIWQDCHEVDSVEVAPMPEDLPKPISALLGRGDEGDCIVIEGECRRSPPQIGDKEMRWPSVNAVEWCSMFEMKGKKSNGT